MYKWKEDTMQTGKPKTKPVLEAMIETAQEMDYKNFALESIGRYVVDQYKKGFTTLQLR